MVTVKVLVNGEESAVLVKLRVHHLYAAKISILEHLFTEPLSVLKQSFRTGISASGITLRAHNSIWTFMDVEQIHEQDRELIIGRLCRGRDEKSEVLDIESSTPTLKLDNFPNVATWSNFVFDYETEIVVFEEKSGRISIHQFIEVFLQLIIVQAPEIGNLESEFIPFEENIKEQIKKFNKIKYAKFHLKPANWDFEDEFSDLDEQLKLLRSHKATQIYESKDGLNTESNLFRKPVNMIIAGYGNFVLSGIDNEGSQKKLNSKDELWTQTIDAPDGEPSEVSHHYITFLEKVIKQHRGGADNVK